MINYNVHVCGTVEDSKTGFKCGFDFTVENGGTVENVATGVQHAIDSMVATAKTNKELSDAEAKAAPVEGK